MLGYNKGQNNKQELCNDVVVMVRDTYSDGPGCICVG